MTEWLYCCGDKPCQLGFSIKVVTFCLPKSFAHISALGNQEKELEKRLSAPPREQALLDPLLPCGSF